MARARRQVEVPEGFVVARLPEPDLGQSMRPVEAIAARLLAQISVFSWASASTASDARVKERLLDGREPQLTRRERAILALPRKSAFRRHSMMIGWSLESMWSLAWVLGMRHAPRANDAMLSNAMIDAILDFADSPRGLDALVARAKPREAGRVIAHEHALRQIHNAAVSALLGRKTVPRGFDAQMASLVLDKRRQGLLWTFSPRTSWDRIAAHT